MIPSFPVQSKQQAKASAASRGVLGRSPVLGYGVGLRCWIGDGRAEDVAVAEGCRAIAIRRWLCYRSAIEQGLAIGINRRAVGGIPHIVPDAYNHIIGRRSIVIVA